MNFKNIFNTISSNINSSKWTYAYLIGSYLFYKTIYKVEPGFQSIKFDIFNGVMPKVYKEGYHIMIPFVQRAIIFDCRMKNHIFISNCATKDLQILQLKSRLISRPDTENLPGLYRLLGLDFEERILKSIVYEIIGAVVSQYNASQLINQRDTISFLIKQKLQEKAKEFFMELDDVALIDITFSKEFCEAIERKQVAQQEAERMKFLVEQALEDKKSTIIRARGEAESVKKFGEANKIGSAFLELRKIETARYISSVLSRSSNKVVLDANTLYMNLPPVNKNI